MAIQGQDITYNINQLQDLLDKVNNLGDATTETAGLMSAEDKQKVDSAITQETDPTVPSWAKASDKPSYSASEVGAVPTTRKVNNRALSADVTLSASDVGALSSDTPLFSGSYDDLTDKPSIPDSLSDLSDDSTHRLVTDAEKTVWNGKSDFSGSYNDLTDKPTIPAAQVNADWNATSGVAKILNKPTIPAEQIQSDWNQSNTSAKDYIKNKPTIPVVPSNVSAFTNDAGYITSYTETDPVFSASAAHSITSADISMWNTRKAQSIPFGHVDSSSIATAFTATVEGITALEDGVCCYLNNTVITSAASTTTPKCWTLNINNLGAKPVYVTTAAATFSTTQFTLNYKFLFTYDSSLNNGEGGWYIGQLFNTNTTYNTITQAEIDAGTGTKARNITPKLLRDNFYTEDEVDGLLADKADSADLAAVATSGSYNDLDDKPTIPTVPTTLSSFTDDLGSSPTHTHSQYLTSAPVTSVNGQTGAVSLSIPTESTVSGWGFTKNAGTITGVTMNGASKGTSGVVDLGTVITVHQDISGKENTSNKVTSLSSASTDTQYPSAKATYTYINAMLGDIETLLSNI